MHRIKQKGGRGVPKQKRPEIVVVGHYVVIGGEKRSFDLLHSNLPDRCKQAIAEMVSGKKYELVEAS